jgi:hypothetical protein
MMMANIPTGQPSELNTIPAALKSLDDAISGLGERVSSVENRIKPILTQNETAPALKGGEVKALDGNSALAQQIASMDARVRAATNRLTEILGQMEI